LTVFACVGGFLLGALAGWLAHAFFNSRFDPDNGTSIVGSEPRSADETTIDYSVARRAGFVVSGPENLEIIEGIGPAIATYLRANGVLSLARLAAMSEPSIRDLLDRGGSRFKIANPSTWAEQAALAAANRWEDLRALQDDLSGGVRRPNPHRQPGHRPA
jgi:predicted flap endonuclease-1-like 5' DNA nuclease